MNPFPPPPPPPPPLANRDDKNDDEEEEGGKNTTRFHHAKALHQNELWVFELEQRNELLGKQAKSWQEKCARTSEREREAQREARFTRELNAKMTNDLIESEASRMRLRAEVDRLLTNGKRKEKEIQILKEEVEKRAQTHANEIQEQMEMEKEKLRDMMEGDQLVNALIGKLFTTTTISDEKLEETSDERRGLLLATQRVQFAKEKAKHEKLVDELEKQLTATKKRVLECESFQSETASQLSNDRTKLSSTVARLTSLVERLANTEKSKDDEIARLRQKRRALEKELDDVSAELECAKAANGTNRIIPPR